MKGKGYTNLTIPQARQLLAEDRRATLVDTRGPKEYLQGTRSEEHTSELQSLSC